MSKQRMKSYLIMAIIIVISSFSSVAQHIREADFAIASAIDALYNSPLEIGVEAASPANDTIRPLTKSMEQLWWWNQLKHGTLNIADTAVIYPKFLQFCVNVYNWGDRTFNSYNPDYVVGTGKRWKFRIVNENWNDNYIMKLPNNLRTDMASDFYSNIGAYLQYMAVSYGYSYDMANIVGRSSTNHKKWEFGFNCALFNAQIYYHENKGGTFLRKFGKYKDGHFFKEKFPGVELHNLGIEVYYFFNNKKYSQGAAYNFSKIQKKSQGSFIIGLNYTNQKINFDFLQLPDNLKPYLTVPENNYLFHYKSYNLMLGYGFNWVIAPKLLYNISAMPSFGISHCYEDSIDGDKWMFSFNVTGHSSLTYNFGHNFFFGLIAKMNGHLYRSGAYSLSLFSTVINLSANIGIRF